MTEYSSAIADSFQKSEYLIFPFPNPPTVTRVFGAVVDLGFSIGSVRWMAPDNSAWVLMLGKRANDGYVEAYPLAANAFCRNLLGSTSIGFYAPSYSKIRFRVRYMIYYNPPTVGGGSDTVAGYVRLTLSDNSTTDVALSSPTDGICTADYTLPLDGRYVKAVTVLSSTSASQGTGPILSMQFYYDPIPEEACNSRLKNGWFDTTFVP